MIVWCTIPWDQIDQALLPTLGLQSGPEMIQQTITEIITNCSNRVGGSSWFVFIQWEIRSLGFLFFCLPTSSPGSPSLPGNPSWPLVPWGSHDTIDPQIITRSYYLIIMVCLLSLILGFTFCSRQYCLFFKCHIKGPFSISARGLYCNIGLNCLLAHCNEVKDSYAEDWNDEGG
jgi:hypothetical protein